ncbi:biotin transporter BioY [Ligilactobacillus sp. WC1T17]
MALMLALLIVLGLFPGIPLGFIPVPIVLQNLGVILAGLLLGPKKGTLTVGTFLLLVACGLPFLTGGSGGIAHFLSPTGGYLFAWLLTPWLMGSCEKIFNPKHQVVKEFIFIWLFGVLFIDGCGALWLSVYEHMSLIKALAANIAFIPGDSLKAVLALLLVQGLLKNKQLASQLQ